MCYLDAIIGPSPLETGGIVLAVAVGVILLCGIVLVNMGFTKSKQKKDNDTEETE